jgi:hypothetical protein
MELTRTTYRRQWKCGSQRSFPPGNGVQYHFVLIYNDPQNEVKLYDSTNGLVLTRGFGHEGLSTGTGFEIGHPHTPSVLSSQVFIENRPWTDQEVQGYFANYFPPNTGSGTNVSVQPFVWGTTPVTITFASVSQSGNTIVSTSATGPALPSGFQLGDPPTFYNGQSAPRSRSGLCAQHAQVPGGGHTPDASYRCRPVRIR